MATGDVFDRDLLKALGHPLRLRILEETSDSREASPVELARRLGRPLATVSHHVRLLRDLGFLEPTRTAPRRGAVEHFYRVVNRPFIDDAQWQQLPVVLRRGLAMQTFRMVFAEAAEAGGAGGFDEPGAHLVRVPLELDGRGRGELSEALVALLKEAEAIQRRSDARRESGAGAAGGPVQPSSAVVLHYRTATSPSPTAPASGRRPRRGPRPRLP